MKKGDDKKGDSPNFLSEKGTVPFFYFIYSVKYDINTIVFFCFKLHYPVINEEKHYCDAEQ